MYMPYLVSIIIDVNIEFILFQCYVVTCTRTLFNNVVHLVFIFQLKGCLTTDTKNTDTSKEYLMVLRLNFFQGDYFVL